ncbi:hypothetical protein SDC9_96508 [bioreactor metagenome]|uniref:Uncharacterized protein n=1 Tax=bioreactor metagenome TaxID=1076179 RepID=A0A645A9V8_9ZZZZ
MMFTNIITDTPLPNPYTDICSPIHTNKAEPVVIVISIRNKPVLPSNAIAPEFAINAYIP